VKRAQPRGKSAVESPAGAQNKGKSGGGDGRMRRKALGKRRRSPSRKEGEDELTGADAATGEGEDEERRASYERGMEKNEADRVNSATATASQSATEAVLVEPVTGAAPMEKTKESDAGGALPLTTSRMEAAMTLGGGVTTAARRRKRRTEAAVAAAHGIMTRKLREFREERAKVLRVIVRQARDQLQRDGGRERRRDHVQGLQAVATAVKKSVTLMSKHSVQPKGPMLKGAD
jgi:hypothetical protein